MARRKKPGPLEDPPEAEETPVDVPIPEPRGAFTVNATDYHESGSHASRRDEVCALKGAPLGGAITGVWVSAGALVYGEPWIATIGRSKGPGEQRTLTRTDDTALIAPVEDMQGTPSLQAVLFALDRSVTLAKGDTFSLCWRNKSGKRCGHYVACAMKG